MNAPYLKETPEGAWLSVKLQPRASQNQIGTAQGSELKISVTAPPVDSAANDAAVRFLAEILDCSRSQVELARGHTSRHKSFLIRGLSAAQILQKLKPR